ncbi:tryptophan halogenase family protein [Teredinibacter purpureus]|uniref:tryptophan halogenase family protein n=1 Tax=Teredinibacter purpureus TaxID=2731756 RepID=UPI0005F83C44|nr:tryptophan halogenase family protein [Teredinibacter purpureus]
METNAVKEIIIAGGGTAGWMTAAALVRALPSAQFSIVLVESSDIGTVGVGEATIPHLRNFNQFLGLDEHEFLQRTKGTYKLGIEFIDWSTIGAHYMHPFSEHGRPLEGISFHHLWRRHFNGDNTPSIDRFCLPIQAAHQNKFAPPNKSHTPELPDYSYAYHLDATLYAEYLQQYAVARGVTRIEGTIAQISQSPHTGDITALTLANGATISGDFFIDCTGFRGLLIEGTLKAGYEDWSHWLRCDRAVAVASTGNACTRPTTKSTARAFGWQWNIPLRHRTGNGYVYCSDYCDDAQAEQTLLNNIDGDILNTPKILRFTAGKRKVSWKNNCVAIGLSSGFLEPLESTSIYLIQFSIFKLLDFFPNINNNTDNRFLRHAFNNEHAAELDRIRDFLILHYHATQRNDSEFWNYCRTMTIPASLENALELFKQQGYTPPASRHLFAEPSWVAVLLGQGIVPSGYAKNTDAIAPARLKHYFEAHIAAVEKGVKKMSAHAEHLK